MSNELINIDETEVVSAAEKMLELPSDLFESYKKLPNKKRQVLDLKLLEPNLSMQKIADRIGISQPYVCGILNSNDVSNIIGYFHLKQISNIKKQLDEKFVTALDKSLDNMINIQIDSKSSNSEKIQSFKALTDYMKQIRPIESNVKKEAI